MSWAEILRRHERSQWDPSSGERKELVLRMKLVGALNLPVPGHFCRPSSMGHLPIGKPALGLNPYASVRHGDSRRRTRSSPGDAWPKWNCDFEFALTEKAGSRERPLLQPDLDILIHVMSEDKYTMDSLIGSVGLNSTQLINLLPQHDSSVTFTKELQSATGLPLMGAGLQQALIELRVEITWEELKAEGEESRTSTLHIGKDDTQADGPGHEWTLRFFEKLEQSPVWRGRRGFGHKTAHIKLDVPELPFADSTLKPESILCQAGVMEEDISRLRSFLDGLPHESAGGKTGVRKSAIKKQLAMTAIGVDRASLNIMFDRDEHGARDEHDALVDAKEFLGLLAREPTITRSIAQKLSNPRVDVDKLMVEAEEGHKALQVLQRFKLVDGSYQLRKRDPGVWHKCSTKLAKALESSQVVNMSTQADIDPFENDLFIHYKQVQPFEQHIKPHPRSLRADTLLPGATSRPPSDYRGVRVDLISGRAMSAFEGPPLSKEHEHRTKPAPHELLSDIKSCVSITVTDKGGDKGGEKGAGGEGTKETQNVHQFTHMGVRMLEAALRPGNWYTNSRTQPGTMCAFKRAEYWAPEPLRDKVARNVLSRFQTYRSRGTN